MMPRIKICGLRDTENALLAARAGADAIGFVFYAPSPRNVEIDVAARIVAALPAFVSSVALFVDADPALVREVIGRVKIDLLQFHGDEAPEYCRQFGRPYIKAVRVKPDTNLVEYCAQYPDAKGVLVDAFVDGTPGGTGEAFDWTLLPNDLPLPLILSGGLHPDNVTDAVRKVRPWAVDVSSGVEAARGIKDPARIQAFIHAVAAAQSSLAK
ncbi:N-(5'-phosphoribosyl)anthranilate isomerase [Andreprevotia sp. IGB-42]|uniref:phosphoribosylanthranilate isomerase n=1 Tax=Andreprevotia sp. IGB-42 TaxID=2497473 RepID=UPI001357859F|nr:phosphoribosylanthranilate isomerase [Andreprevotia sp. IGB-42]KAF0815004.1 N-(5'-phosphoribosyl)anthranilate isomerase [Andreprevotia sp. IGB-42]